MYGGKRNYVLTLRKVLERINQENPSMDRLVSWLRGEYKGASETVPYGVLRVVSKCLGFMQESGGRVKLTPLGEEFLRTGENHVVLDALNRSVLGFEEIMSMLAENRELSMAEVNRQLVEKLGLNWKTTAQTMYRLNWLDSLGFVTEQHGRYSLSGKVPPKPAPGPQPQPTPIDDYVKHAKALIEKHPTMSESNTVSTLIEPLLEVLGWKTRDLDEVQRGYQVHIGDKTEYVDIALKINDRPAIFIEAKSVDIPFQDHLAEQPIKYANAEGVSWCVLTNGRELGVYNAFWKIKGIEQKTLFKLSINDYKEKTDKLLLLSKDSLTSGRLEEEGEFEHARRMITEWLRQKENSIVKGIMELDPSLKEEYVKRVLRKIL
jgi:predicted type IV restriction endonuclease